MRAPTRSMRLGTCCACAVSDHDAAVPQISVTKSRRLIEPPERLMLALRERTVRQKGSYRPYIAKTPNGRGRDEDFSSPPAQIPACAANAPGSSLGSDVVR